MYIIVSIYCVSIYICGVRRLKLFAGEHMHCVGVGVGVGLF